MRHEIATHRWIWHLRWIFLLSAELPWSGMKSSVCCNRAERNNKKNQHLNIFETMSLASCLTKQQCTGPVCLPVCHVCFVPNKRPILRWPPLAAKRFCFNRKGQAFRLQNREVTLFQTIRLLYMQHPHVQPAYSRGQYQKAKWLQNANASRKSWWSL